MTGARFRGSNLVAAGILLSRIAGTLRTIVLGVVLGGDKIATDAFAAAMRIPNLLQNLLGEGSLSASFIPVYARLVEHGESDPQAKAQASALAGAVVSLLALLTSVLVVIGVLAARPLIWLFTSWETNEELYELTIRLTRITTVGLGFMVVSAWCLGVLNSHRNFFLSYVAPVVWNIIQIMALVIGGLLAWSETDIVTVLAWAMVAGSIGQVVLQLPKVMALAPDLRPNLNLTAELRSVLDRFAPAVGARGVLQVSSFADTFLAATLVGGAMSWYFFALPLYITPISVFGFSVAASELAEMSRTSGAASVVSGRLRPALRRVVLPAAFITAAYMAASPVIVDALYGWLSRLLDRGLSGPEPIHAIAYLLAAFAIGLPATMTSRVSQNTLYSLGDVKGPARISVIRLVVSVTVSVVAMLQLDWLMMQGSSIVEHGAFPHWPPWERVPQDVRDAADGVHLGVVGLGLGSSAGAWVEWVLLRRRLGDQLGSQITSGLGSTPGLAAVAAGLVMGGVRWLDGLVGFPSPVDAVLVVGAGVAAFLAVLIARDVDLAELG